ncbi:MAG: hypothetical protein NTX45_14050 [Proteobacteria bacterium]|nr:hypothetical protein [Pseudomonadota bacterium]
MDNFNSLFYPHFADRLPTRSSSHLPTALGGLTKPRPVLASTNSTRTGLIPVEAEAAQVACFGVGDFHRWSGFGQAAFLSSVCAGCMPLVLLAISWCGFWQSCLVILDSLRVAKCAGRVFNSHNEFQVSA